MIWQISGRLILGKVKNGYLFTASNAFAALVILPKAMIWQISGRLILGKVKNGYLFTALSSYAELVFFESNDMANKWSLNSRQSKKWISIYCIKRICSVSHFAESNDMANKWSLNSRQRQKWISVYYFKLICRISFFRKQ